MSRLILVRHGQSVLNQALRYSGQQETPLTPLGEAQHGRLRDRLAGAAIGRVISSDLERCLALAAGVATDHGLSAEPDPALREAAFGAWEGLTYAEALARDRTAMVSFNRDRATVAPPGGESLAAVDVRARDRLAALLREHTGREGALLLVSHGGPLRALLCSLLAIPLARHWTLRVDPAALTVLDVYPRGPMVAVLNDTCHLHGLAG